MTGAIRRYLNKDKSEFDPRKYLKDAMQSAKDICKARYVAFGSAGQASKIRPLPLDVMASRYGKGELDPVVN
jgi:fructose-bisphosphate aldolase class II